jgi:hypothetical protein
MVRKFKKSTKILLFGHSVRVYLTGTHPQNHGLGLLTFLFVFPGTNPNISINILYFALVLVVV